MVAPPVPFSIRKKAIVVWRDSAVDCLVVGGVLLQDHESLFELCDELLGLTNESDSLMKMSRGPWDPSFLFGGGPENLRNSSVR